MAGDPTRPTRVAAPNAESSAGPLPGHTAPASAGTTPPAGPLGTLSADSRLGPYRVVRQLGRGGMGAVYLAEDVRLRRLVALKVLAPGWAADPSAKDRFLREARAAAAVRHDHVVTIYEVGQEADTPFIAMELLRGATLDSYLAAKGPPEPGQALRIGREVAEGLAAAHAKGLVHRDVKPANVWLEAPAGRVKLLDFGLAQADRTDARLTAPGVVVGTPAYMAPEQARGERVDGRSDLFGLGGVLYTLCTGRPPFAGPTTMAVLTALATDRPTPAQALNPDVPPGMSSLIDRLLQKLPEDRSAFAADVARELRALERSLMATAPMSILPAPGPEGAGDPGSAGRTAEPAREGRRGGAAGTRWRRASVWLAGALALATVGAVAVNSLTGPGATPAPRPGPADNGAGVKKAPDWDGYPPPPPPKHHPPPPPPKYGPPPKFGPPPAKDDFPPPKYGPPPKYRPPPPKDGDPPFPA
jgi:eukaryotic-like serine/threonine-protein kinase